MNNQAKLIRHKCIVCGKEFFSKGARANFCSKECHLKANLQKVIGLPFGKQKLICQTCGKEYEIDPYAGSWNKNNVQCPQRTGMAVYKYCCYECGAKIKGQSIHIAKKNSTKPKKKPATKKAICVVCGKIDTVGGNYHGTDHVCNDPICKEIWRAYKRDDIPLEPSIQHCKECGKEIHYVPGQGCWDKNNRLVHASKHHCFASYNFCCYECGIKHKEKLRKKSNLKARGYTSPWQNPEWRLKQYEKHKEDGTLYSSKPEKEIRTWIESLGIKTTKFIQGAGETRIEIDIYIPDKNVGIEYNGTYFHSLNGRKEDRISTRYHYNKALKAKELGIDLIQIWEDQWYNKQDIMKDIIKTRLGLSTNVIYARQCKIKEVDNKTYKDFCIKYHSQGYRAAKIKYGLYKDNELVQIASFNKCSDYGARKAKYEYEWIRGIIKADTNVVGGTSKLLQYFIKENDPQSILCYCDWNLFNGRGYEKAGFEFDGYTGPDKFFIRQHSLERIMRSPFRYKEMKELIQQKKVFDCCGAGSIRFVWKKQ